MSAQKHQSNMSIARKKACAPCTSAKTRCDQARGGCTRCRKRRTLDQCTYASQSPEIPGADHAFEETLNSTAMSSGSCELETPNGSTMITGELSDGLAAQLPVLPALRDAGARHSVQPTPSSGSVKTLNGLSHVIPLSRQPNGSNELNFSGLDLVCTVDAEAIRDRWQNQYFSAPGQEPKSYSASTTAFLSRLLKAYASAAMYYTPPSMLRDGPYKVAQYGTLPPFIHHTQQTRTLATGPLANCFSLATLCNKALPPSTVKEMFEREMSTLRSEYQGYGELDLLEAFQAYLIYAMLIYFNFDETRDSGLQEMMIHMKDIACEVSRRGLVSSAELGNTRPSWESWIIAESRRRTIYLMYLFDSVLCVRDGLPVFLGTELRSTPAPAARLLWQASDRDSWSQQYNAYIHQWSAGGPLRIEELWPIPPEMTEAEVATRRSRVDYWLTTIDELGTMLFGVTSTTHGG